MVLMVLEMATMSGRTSLSSTTLILAESATGLWQGKGLKLLRGSCDIRVWLGVDELDLMRFSLQLIALLLARSDCAGCPAALADSSARSPFLAIPHHMPDSVLSTYYNH